MAPIRGPGVNRRSFLAILAAATGLGWLGLRGGGGGVPIIPGPARTDEESWRKLLAELSGLAIADPEIRPLLTGEQVARRWLGEPPAEEEEIATAERRLGTRLPASYRAFLRVSNGWHHPSSFVGLVSPVAAVAPSGDDAVMLLNPVTLSAAGEMEAWFFANWVPGANIYPSFWHPVREEPGLHLPGRRERRRVQQHHRVIPGLMVVAAELQRAEDVLPDRIGPQRAGRRGGK